jgi:hypothetical protein
VNIRETILQDFRKPNMLLVVDWIGNNPTRFKELMAIFMGNEYRTVQRSAWVLSLVVDKHPELVNPYLPSMVSRMQEEGHEAAVRRNIVRILQFVDLPEDLHGIVMDNCFRFAGDPNEAIAVRCCSLVVLSRLAKLYPEIVPELQAVIEEGLEHGATAAFRASSRQVYKALKLNKARS